MQLEIILDSKALEAAIGRMRGPAVNRAITASLERRANDARREAVRVFTSASIGKGIFGRNDRGAWKIITLGRIQQQGDTISMALKAAGLAALQETGGRIKPHVIKPKRAKVLAFASPGGFGFGGEMAFAPIVHHPGATVPRHVALVPAAEKIPAQVVEDVRKALVALWTAAA